MNLTTVENVKGYLAINTAADDALLDRLVTSASEYIQTWLNRSLGVATYSEVFDGTNSNVRMVANYPITAVQSVTVDTQSIALASDALSSGYGFAERRVVLRGYRFTQGVLNCTINYTAGYAAVPADLGQACIEMVANRYREKDRIGLVSKGLAGETIAFSQKDMPDAVRTVLNVYKKVVPIQ